MLFTTSINLEVRREVPRPVDEGKPSLYAPPWLREVKLDVLDSILVQVLHPRRKCLAISHATDALLQLASGIYKHEQPDTVLRSLDKAVADILGYKLFTVVLHDAE